MAADALHVDFETRSAVDLKTAGTYLYARDVTTAPWCMAFCFGAEPVDVWDLIDDPCGSFLHDPSRVFEHVKNGGLVYAHNAPFEFAIWNYLCVPRFGWPPLRLEQLRCTMAMAYAMALPGALDKAAPAAGITQRKDMAGHRPMMQMAKPRTFDELGVPIWWDDFDRRRRLAEYCKQDVEVERELCARLLPLSESEQKLWVLDQRINARGIHVDVPTIKNTRALVDAEKKRHDAQMREITGGFVSACTNTKCLTLWIQAQGVRVPGVAKADVLDALDGELPPIVRKALTLRQEAAKSSTAKLRAMLEGAADDQRVRDTKQYHGANTGRWAGRRVQPDNLVRPKFKQPVIEHLLSLLNAARRDEIDTVYGPLLEVIASCTRAMICAADGNELFGADWSAIEARITAWLAGEEWKLKAFRDFDAGTGPDPYRLVYAKSFGIALEDVTSDQRQIGKVEELALGFEGGVGAFQSMARDYGIDVSDARAEEIKVGWRTAHPKIKAYWRNLNGAAIHATRSPGVITKAGAPGREVKFRRVGSFLWCLLPSARAICFPYPQLHDDVTPWGEPVDKLTYMGVDSLTHKWVRMETYGGKLCENVTQATARDVLRDGLHRLEIAGYPVVMHVHDEIIAERKLGEGSLDMVEGLLSVSPKWAPDLPLVAKGWRGVRYRKE